MFYRKNRRGLEFMDNIVGNVPSRYPGTFSFFSEVIDMCTKLMFLILQKKLSTDFSSRNIKHTFLKKSAEQPPNSSKDFLLFNQMKYFWFRNI
jgi:hypothetical protein